MADPITDAELLGAGASVVPAAAGPLQTGDAITDADVMQASGPSFLEALGRGSLSGATFNYEDELGIADRARQAAAREARPWAYLSGEVLGGFAPMVGASFIPGGQAVSGARAAGLLARVGRLARGALLPGRADTVGSAARTGAKLGAVYGGLSGSGNAEPGEGDSWMSALGRRLAGAGIGAGTGLVVGAPVGAGLHGVSRVVGAAINRVSPALAEAVDASRYPESQGIRDFLRTMGYDKYTPEDLRALRARLDDPAQRGRYEDLNLIEALETRPLEAMPGTGELRPPVVVSPNLTRFAQNAANTEGVGRQEAVLATMARADAIPNRLTQNVNRTFGQLAATPDQEAGMLARNIDRAFGSGNAAQEEATLAAQRAAFNKRYEKLREQPLVLNKTLADMLRIPQFAEAMNYAAVNDMIENPTASWGGRWLSRGVQGGDLSNPALNESLEAAALRLGQATRSGDTAAIQEATAAYNAIRASIPEGSLASGITLSPANILDIHHQLVLMARPTLGGDPAKERLMGLLKRQFTNWVGEHLKGFDKTNAAYAAFRRVMDAQEAGQNLPITGAGMNHEAVTFLNGLLKQRQGYIDEATKQYGLMQAAVDRFRSGARTTLPKEIRTKINAAMDKADEVEEALGALRRNFGERIKNELNAGATAGAPGVQNVDGTVARILSPEGSQRILQVLGDREGPAFLNFVNQLAARRHGANLGINAGGSDNASLQFLAAAQRAGRDDVVDVFRAAWGNRLKDEIQRSTDNGNRVVRQLLTPEGKNRIIAVLGPEAGRDFIEVLYNKFAQQGLSKRLFGNSDTAYKLAAQNKAMQWANLARAVASIPPRPMQIVSSLQDIASSAIAQRRADQANALLSRQGPTEVGAILDAILARQQLRTTGTPYVSSPGLRLLGPGVSSATYYEVAPSRSRRRTP